MALVHREGINMIKKNNIKKCENCIEYDTDSWTCWFRCVTIRPDTSACQIYIPKKKEYEYANQDVGC